LDSKCIRITSVSDIHLLHRNNKTEYIIRNLDTYLCSDEILGKTDILFIAGDLFDGPSAFSNDDIGLINIWVAKLLHKCKRFNICLRVLEGTPSHDMNQSKVFTNIHQMLFKDGTGVDLQYVKTLSIEHIARFGIHVLYVPDEWNHDTFDTLVEVKGLLKSNGLSQVDFAVMHGQFEYQLADVVKAHVKHDSSEYLALVKHLIFIGHIHKHSSMDRIFSHGSFDRLAHNEEEAKGFVYAVVNQDGSYECEFVENKNARIYKSVKCATEDIELNMKRIDKVAAKLPIDSFIRIVCSKDNTILSAQDELKKRWPSLNWSFSKDKEKDKSDITAAYTQEKKYTPIIINKDSIRNLLVPRLIGMQVPSHVMARCNAHITEMERL
jgi:DNA repair exonuclease SbcCD nuclease subunit